MTISVLITTYDAAAFVGRAIASALAQSPAPVEILVIDDCSRDDTCAVVESLAAAEPSIRLLSTARNGGPSAARNLGIRMARGDWVAILDADDAFAAGRLQRVERLLAAREAAARPVDVVLDGLSYYDAVARQVTGAAPDIQGSRDVDLLAYVQHNRAIEGELDWGLLKPVLRRQFLLDSAIGYDEGMRHGEDFAFMVALLAAGAACVLDPTPGYVYTQRSGAVSGRSSGMSRTVIGYDALARHALELASTPPCASDPAMVQALQQRARGLGRLGDAAFVSGALRRGDVVGLIRRASEHPGFTTGMVRQLGRAVRRRLRSQAGGGARA